MDPSIKLSQVQGIGPYFINRLRILGIETVGDLLFHFPFRYDDFSNLSNAVEAQEGEKVTLIGEIWQIQNIYTKTGKTLTKAVFYDGSGPIDLTWFNQSWLTKSLAPGDKVQVSGKVSRYKNRVSIIAPVWEKINSPSPLAGEGRGEGLHTGRLVPVYPETEGLTSKWLRAKVAAALPQVLPKMTDPLPESVRGEMATLPESLQMIHYPESYEEVERARERLGFDELFYIQLATIKARNEWKKQPATQRLTIDEKRLTNFLQSLPYELTGAQKRVVNELIADLNQGVPMNRLVQGEVGSGKTVVAAILSYLIHLNGLQTLYMAPTEILAFQHHTTLTNLLKPHGIEVGIYTGSRKRVEVKTYNLKPKTSDIIVGTHALLSETLVAENVGLVIVDEQQRFGVEQRSLLRSKAKIPHFLTMTATPIPRTVALTIYGDLDISIIDELPKGRQKIQTNVVPNSKRADAYKFIAKKVAEGDQVYIITPLIDFSETLASAKAATVEFEKLRTKVFPDLKMGLLHGRLKSKEKEQVLNDFKAGKIQILVSTSVVEVGVDVPNATILVLESAERFGLAQIHQLRGRVGRGSKQSYCLLFSSDPESLPRLKNLENIDDGLKLAELDLKIRGSGQIFGTMQSGRMELKIASFSDLPLIERSRDAAKKVLEDSPDLEKYPLLQKKVASQAQVAPD